MEISAFEDEIPFPREYYRKTIIQLPFSFPILLPSVNSVSIFIFSFHLYFIVKQNMNMNMNNRKYPNFTSSP